MDQSIYEELCLALGWNWGNSERAANTDYHKLGRREEVPSISWQKMLAFDIALTYWENNRKQAGL